MKGPVAVLGDMRELGDLAISVVNGVHSFFVLVGGSPVLVRDGTITP